MLGRNQNKLAEDGTLCKYLIIHVVHYLVVDLSKTNKMGKKMLSVIQLEPHHLVLQRIGNPVRLRFGDSGVLLGPATGPKDNVEIDEADNVDIDEEANVDIGLEDNVDIGEEYNVDVGEHMVVDVGDMLTYSTLKEKVFKVAASQNFLVNLRVDSAKQFKGKSRIRFNCKQSGKARVKKDTSTTTTQRNRASLRTNCPWHITGYAPVTPVTGESMIHITSITSQHNCKPCFEKAAEITQRSTSKKISQRCTNQYACVGSIWRRYTPISYVYHRQRFGFKN